MQLLTDRTLTAQIKTINLGSSNTNLELLLLETGEQRIEVSSAGEALGEDKNYINDLSKGRKLMLAEEGFTNERKSIFVPSLKLYCDTISIPDFIKIVVQEALSENQQAIVILCVFVEIGLETSIG